MQLTAARRPLVVVEKELSLPEPLCKACESTPAEVRVFGRGGGGEGGDGARKGAGEGALSSFCLNYRRRNLAVYRARENTASKHKERSDV